MSVAQSETVTNLARGSEAAPVILTPEHVPIRLEPAGLGSRFTAVIIDFVILSCVVSVIGLLLKLVVPFGLGRAVSTAAVFFITWSYHVFFEVYRRGQPPGKRLLRLRVVDGRGLPVTPQQSFVRNIVRVLDFAPVFYGLGGIVGLFDRYNRRLGDIAAGTLVIRESSPADYAKRLAKERRFNTLRAPRTMRLIRHRVGLEERELLLSLCLRADGMDPRARFDLTEEIAAHYRKKLQIEDPSLSGENLIRDLTAILYDV